MPDVALSEPEARFQITLWESRAANASEPTAFASAGRVDGIQYGDATPGASETRGACTLVEPGPSPFCDPACGAGTICVAGGTCRVPDPALGAGDITFDGLTVGLTLSPATVYQYYSARFDPEPPAGHLFDAGATLRAHATGGNVPAFDASTLGVAELATTLACPPSLAAGSALIVRWTPAAQGGDRIRFALESGNHASQFVHLSCETDDSGQLEVDGELVARYLAAPRPFDHWSLARVHETSARVDAVAIELGAKSSVDCRW